MESRPWRPRGIHVTSSGSCVGDSEPLRATSSGPTLTPVEHDKPLLLTVRAESSTARARGMGRPRERRPPECADRGSGPSAACRQARNAAIHVDQSSAVDAGRMRTVAPEQRSGVVRRRLRAQSWRFARRVDQRQNGETRAASVTRARDPPPSSPGHPASRRRQRRPVRKRRSERLPITGRSPPCRGTDSRRPVVRATSSSAASSGVISPWAKRAPIGGSCRVLTVDRWQRHAARHQHARESRIDAKRRHHRRQAPRTSPRRGRPCASGASG